MSDPLNDPRFPDRPQTQDFWRLSEVVLYLDGAIEDGTFEEIMSKLVDVPSIEYMANVRCQRFIEHLRQQMVDGAIRNAPDLSTLMAVFLNGFAAGVLFQERGGRRDG